MQQKLNQLKQEIIDKIKSTEILDDLEDLKVEYLGRKGKITKIFKQVKDVAIEEKPVIGKLVNEVKTEIERVYKEVKQGIGNKEVGNRDKKINKIYDTTLPGKDQKIGTLHPITQVKNDLNDVFKFLGFEIYQGPEITSEGYAFDNLNFPPDHPARESMDTYWIKSKVKSQKSKVLNKKSLNKLCLRPHLTGGSVRYMQTHKPPFRFVYPGRAFRAEATDAGHERCFYQYEALIVNKDISFSGGKILIKTILERVFGREVKIRMRSGFFPFVEPGFEIDMECLNCNGKGCPVCKQSGWVEMMPGGPPHPNVLRAGGIDPTKWQGFYINIGLDRLVMMKYGIDDIRLMHSGDLRFLRQF
ncbi:phenylalanine--tRNA ligase subunit alpha [Patescibacteria group bacterium]|nr:phenylalanine--tRNA ligase subunit alpha [Patescibacteria group bacterium]MBU4482096.1 phenylalanine--tRNA ligase subunit alpha [Patescibacteria group bacterium]